MQVAHCTFQGLGIARFLKLFAGFFKALDAVLGQFGQTGLHQRIEICFAAIEVVEAARGFTGQFNMAGLVFTHGHMLGFVNQDVRGLQQGVAQETIGGQVLVLEFLHLVFVGWHTFKPTQGGAHAEQREQLGVLGNAALQKNGALVGVETRRQPVNDHFINVLLDDVAAFVVGGQGMPVGDEVKARHLGLQAHPIFKGAVVVTQMKRAGGAHARKYAIAHEVTGRKKAAKGCNSHWMD